MKTRDKTNGALERPAPISRLRSRRLLGSLAGITLGLSFALNSVAQTGLPQNLPDNLPGDLLITPWDADRVWVERWGSNGDWGDVDLWRTGQQVGENAEVDFDNNVLINVRNVYRNHLQNIVPAPGVPNSAGMSLWVGTADPDANSGNDNINVSTNFTIGQLTVQNVSVGTGRSFRDGGNVIFNSGDALLPARIVHLGNESSEGEDMNIREGTNFQLDSNTEMYLLNTSSRFRIRDGSQITGTGDLILNPGNAADYTGTATGQGPQIQRELRIEDTGRIATTGAIEVNAARVRIVDSADIINTSGIDINPEGQLQLERVGDVQYDLNHGNGAVITLDSLGHLMDDGSSGAIRQQSALETDIARVANNIVVAGDSRLHAEGDGTLVLSGNLSGTGDLIKTGGGLLELTGSSTNSGNLIVNEGNLTLASDSEFTFFIGMSGDNNQIGGSTTGSLILDGQFVFDLSSASLTIGDSWAVVDTGLDVNFGGTFSIADFTFIGDGIWTSNNPHYQFSEITGQLVVIPEPSAVLLGLLALLPLLRRRFR